MESTVLLLFFYGVLSFLSPCFFPVFPSFLAYVFKAKNNAKGGLAAASICTVGIAASFAVYGSFFWLLFVPLSQYGSLLRQVFGLAISVLGGIMLTPVKLVFVRIRPSERLSRVKGPLGIFILGFSYVLIAAPCAMPIFLSTLFLAATLENLLQAILGSVLFALGAGVSLVASSVLVVTARRLLARTYRNVARWFEFICAALLIFTGLLLSLQLL